MHFRIPTSAGTANRFPGRFRCTCGQDPRIGSKTSSRAIRTSERIHRAHGVRRPIAQEMYEAFMNHRPFFIPEGISAPPLTGERAAENSSREWKNKGNFDLPRQTKKHLFFRLRGSRGCKTVALPRVFTFREKMSPRKPLFWSKENGTLAKVNTVALPRG